MGTFDQRGMPIAADPVRREVVAALGVELSKTNTRNETTNVRTISCCSRSQWRRQVHEARSVVESGSAGYSNITATPHEYFYQTRSARNWRAAIR
jgi:hypothetical protein